MASKFDSGVANYVRAYAVVRVNFPIDYTGKAAVNCYQCPFFRRSYSTCGLNGSICQYPQRYVGDNCPLDIEEPETKIPNSEEEI